MEYGNADDDVVRPSGNPARSVGDGESDGSAGRGQLPRPPGDPGVGVETDDPLVRSGGQQPHKIPRAATDIQRGPEPAGQLPQDPTVIVGVVVPGMDGIELF